MRINDVTQAYRAELSKKVDATKRKQSPKAVKADQVSVSQDGKLLSETNASLETAKTTVANAPEVRTERVAEAKRRVDEGYYNSPEFAGKLADKLIQDIGKELGIS